MAVTARAADLWRTAKFLSDDPAFFAVDFPVLAAVPEAAADFLAAWAACTACFLFRLF